jgi:hypothetical protein
MDFTLILMLAALALVYTAWRGARRENQRLRAAREQEIERRSSSLEPLERANGRGYVVVLPDGARADEYETDWEQDGIDIVRLDAFPATPEAATIPAFAPGTAVELIVDDEDERIIWVWDRGMTLRAGRVPDAGLPRSHPRERRPDRRLHRAVGNPRRRATQRAGHF